MRIALTGTPGVGKSTLARLLAEKGECVVDLAKWAEEHGAIDGVDSDGTRIIATDQLDVGEFPESCFIDGHMSHDLAVDVVWLLRLNPQSLKPRLEARHYSAAKVQENLEAEAMDLILQEAIGQNRIVIQRDGTRRRPEEFLSSFEKVTTEALKSSDLEAVDWSDALMDGI
jgi:adenylate kinase